MFARGESPARLSRVTGERTRLGLVVLFSAVLVVGAVPPTVGAVGSSAPDTRPATGVDAAPNQTAYGGEPVDVTAGVAAENFDTGGMGTAANDTDASATDGDSVSPSTEWTTRTESQPQYSAPAVGAEHVYVGGLGPTLSALYPTNGTVAWQFERAGALSDSSPTVADGTVYVGSGGGVLYALAERDGSVEWTHSARSAIVSSPTVAGGTVYVGTNDGRVLALDAADGSVEWNVSVGGAVFSEPAVGDGSVVVTTREGRVVALDAASGGQRWTYETDVALGHSSPAVADATVYVSADRVYAFDASTGEVEWSRSSGGATASSPVVASGILYVGGTDGIRAFDADSGNPEWEVSTDQSVETTPVVVDGNVVVPTSGSARVLAGASGTDLGSVTLAGSVRSGASSGGSVYLWTDERQLAKVQVTGASEGQRWSDPATWGGDKPDAGDTVRIEAGETVVLDESPPPLGGINVSGGTLRFARKDLTLTTDYVMVTDGGRFQVGTEEQPFRQEATITLTADRTELGTGPDHCGIGGLCALGGKLSIHGAVDGPTWTQLNATAQAGDRTLTLKEPVDWDVGDEIVVVSSSYDPGLAERRTITAVDGNTVTLNDSLEFQHYGEMQYFGENDQYSLDERAEVMHLSRNVVVQGDEGSGTDRFGGHVMAMNEHYAEQARRAGNGEEYIDLWKEMDNDRSLMPEIDGVEFRQMGQEGIRARYPFHWHKYGNASGSYVRNSSIHDSYQRCITIHGTQNTTIENNVAFDVVGHCYFMEDGTEWGNHLEDNIGALVRGFSTKDRRLLPESDAVPSVFWWSHPDNTFVGNVAAGAYGFGFWLEPKPHPTGPTGTEAINLATGVRDGTVEFGTFRDNVAHSTVSARRSAEVPRIKWEVGRSGGIGLMVGGHLRSDGRDDAWFQCARHHTPDGPRCDFTDNTYYYNDNAGVWMNSAHSYTRSVNSTFADNGLGGRWGIAHEEGNVFIALSDNRGNPGKSGLGLVENDRVGASKRVQVEELRQWERQVGRALPAKYHPMHSLGQAGADTFEGQIPVAGMDWQYDGAITKGNVFINYEDSEYFDTGAMTMPGNGIAFFTIDNELVGSDQPYLPHSGHQTVFRDIDGTLTGTGEYTEIRQDPGENRSTSSLLDETCTPREDGAYYLCTGTSAEFKLMAVDGEDATVTQHKTGLPAGSELPAGRYDVAETADDSVSFTTQKMSKDHEWVFTVDTSAPLSVDPVDGGHQLRLTEPERVTRVDSRAAFDDTAETLVTLYYDAENDTEYVKLRGSADYDRGIDEFFYYSLDRLPAPEIPRAGYRLTLEVSDG